MTKICVTEHGIEKDNLVCQADKLQALFQEAPDDCEIFFPSGRYYWTKPITITGKKNFTVCGEPGTVIVVHFSPWGDPAENNNGFHGRDCQNLTFRNLTWTTDNPINCVGRVTLVDNEHHWYEVDIDPMFPLTGWEHFWGTDTFDEEGTPDYVIETYDRITKETLIDENGNARVKYTGTQYEHLGNNHIRVFMPENRDLSRLDVGHRVLYRYMIYGATVFHFAGCHDVLLQHIEIARTSGMGAILAPRCSNFTFDDFNIRLAKDDHALYASGADGIHITGLSGYLHMKDCDFLGLGDDALNIHSTAGEVEDLDPVTGIMPCLYRNRAMEPGKLGALWAQEGDWLIVYDRETFLQKGRVLLKDYHDSTAYVEKIEGTVGKGDILANEAFFASVHLDNCTVTHTRARGFLLQSWNMLVENCTIYGMALPGIIVSPDIRVWYEVGPSKNVEIRNCTFAKCGINGSAANMGAIVVKASHDVDTDNYPAGVHDGIHIHHNLFQNCGNSGIFVNAAKNVNIHDNRFENCSCKRFSEKVETNLYDIMLRRCENSTTADNTTTKDAKWLERREEC